MRLKNKMYEFLNKFYRRIYLLLWGALFKREFNCFGKKSSIYKPRSIQGLKYIDIGSFTSLMPDAWLLALKIDENIPKLIISDRCYIGHSAHIVAVKKVVIEDSVLIADKVYISDNLHSFDAIDIPIIEQKVKFHREVLIKEGAWIGENVCIIGATVGRNSVVAANSVVTKDVPDFCVVAGIPAKVIKCFCHESQSWKKVSHESK
ncbi:acyltransferase [Shewanella baltica]|uniref:acyltransferase n=1 Tax=Shewanella baltica TaxID=62322 RepID=UPI003D79DF0F